MKNLKNRVISCLLIGITLVLAYFYSNIHERDCIYNKDADVSTYISTGTLSEGEELSQTFIAQNKSMDEIQLKVDLLGDVSNVVLQYKLLDDNSNVLYQDTISALELENQTFNTLKISPIEHADGQKYTLVLSEQNANPQNGVSFYLTSGRTDGDELIIKGNSTDASLLAEMTSDGFDAETFFVLLGMIAFIVVFMKILYKMFK